MTQRGSRSVSRSQADIYYVGRFQNHTFRPSASTPFTSPTYTPTSRFGHKIAKTGGDVAGRRLLWGAICGLPGGSIPNPRSAIAGASPTHGGCTMSLGQEVTLSPSYKFGSVGDGTPPLRFRFLRELRSLRVLTGNGSYTGENVTSGTRLPGGRLFELEAVFGAPARSTPRAAGGGAFGLDLFGGRVQLRYNESGRELYLAGGALVPVAAIVPVAGLATSRRVATHLRLREREKLSVHVFVDGSVVEAIACARAPIAANVLPPADAELSVSPVGAPLERVAVWQLTPSVKF